MRLINSIVRRCLQCTPYELRRRQAEQTLPPSCLESIHLVLAYYCMSNSEPTLVQIGACDGVSGDPIYNFVRQGRMRAVLVEPIGERFRKLNQAYQGVPNLTTIQAAIGKKDGSATLYKVREDGKALDAFWSQQLASFQKSHLLKHGVPEEEIESVEVPCLTLGSLLAKCNLTGIDCLQVDTEGADAEVVKMALELPVMPECINFENAHLTAPAATELFATLKAHGYVWIHAGSNTLAVHARLIERWESAVASLSV